MYERYLKRIFDLIISFVALLIIFPILVIVTLILMFGNKGKPFFIHKRPGRYGRIFKLIKFKTMNDKRDAHGLLLLDIQRLTNIGKVIRKTSIDEIPQLLNVIKGDMSLVGPRPLLPEYLPLYNDFQHRRHEVKPGITGWAQLNGRNAITWQQKFEYDVWYVENLSFLLDMKIILLTINKVFKREGISSRTSVTMERFLGNNKLN